VTSPSFDHSARAKADRSRLLAPDKGVFDFVTVSNFARDYLSTYYCQPPTHDEQAVLSFLIRHYPKIESLPCAIEIGCGPTVHHVLPLAPYVSEIHMADYLADNLEQVRLWRDNAEDAHSWHEYTSLTLVQEGGPASPVDVRRREDDTRNKISRLIQCDLKRDSPLGSRHQYAAVGCFYCAENIGVTKDEWRRVMHRVAELTAPRGYLFMSALCETDFYVVKAADGTLNRLPSAFLTERDFRELLPAVGFDPQHTVIESQGLTGQEQEGVNGVILVAARKQ
jgi:hypothetical protein